jgi:YesN/AraC family two-component response regulator
MRKDPRLPVQSKVLLLQLIELIMNETGRFAADTAARPRISDTVINYVEANYYRPLNVREICACTHLNPDYAGKLFKKETGMSLITYLNSYRINKAKRLLLDTDLNIADVSEMVGFQNENYFCSVSKKLTGATPARLRAYMLSTLDEEA